MRNLLGIRRLSRQERWPIFLMITACCAAALICGAATAASASDVEEGGVVRQELEKAYQIAQSVFTDFPRGRLSLANLYQYGFRPPEDVTIRIVDGRKNSLLITGESEEGIGVFAVDSSGNVALREERARRIRR